MRDATRDSVTSGGPQAPLGARGEAGSESAAMAGHDEVDGARPGRGLPLADRPRLLAVVLALALAAYAAIAADVVEGGRLSAFDDDISAWVARSMPSWTEWIARVLSWIGGWVGVTLIVAVVVVWLARRGVAELGVLLILVALGAQLINSIAKAGYDRARPTAGSPIALPASSSFPSGHAMTGIAVFGLLGLLLARELPSRRARSAAICAGFALGALIAASRVVLNVHFLTDVLGGAALGHAWLAACLLLWNLVAARRRRYADPS